MELHMDARHISADKPRFEAERWILAPHGKSAVVRLAQALSDAAILVNHEVLVDGCTYICARVDTPHSPPFRTGDYVTLLVETPE